MADLAAQTGYTIREVRMVNSSAETIMLGPIVIIELLIIKLLSRESLRRYRSNIVAIFAKAADGQGASPEAGEILSRLDMLPDAPTPV